MENNYDSDSLTTEGWNKHIKNLKIVPGRKIIIERKKESMLQKLIKI